jgi:hypothetical protein
MKRKMVLLIGCVMLLAVAFPGSALALSKYKESSNSTGYLKTTLSYVSYNSTHWTVTTINEDMNLTNGYTWKQCVAVLGRGLTHNSITKNTGPFSANHTITGWPINQQSDKLMTTLKSQAQASGTKGIPFMTFITTSITNF